MKITAQIQGGLGNQLFQYATGKALSMRLGGQLLLDIDWFNHDWEDVTARSFLLPNLNLQYRLSQATSPVTSPKRWRRIAQQILPLSPYILKDRPYRFNPALNQFKPFTDQDIYLMGYWQSYRYFDSIRNELLKELQPSKALSSHYQAYQEKILGTSSVMVHVRRGDYLHLPVAAKIHGSLDLDYYRRGMDLLLAKEPKSRFFIFSDDQDWAKANLPYQEKSCFVENSPEPAAPVQELFLMTQCQRHLIANSSLSWWGAWLSSGSNPQVIAPNKWANDLDKNWNDLLPPTWHRI